MILTLDNDDHLTLDLHALNDPALADVAWLRDKLLQLRSFAPGQTETREEYTARADHLLAVMSTLTSREMTVHPTPGWISVAPIPEPKEDEPTSGPRIVTLSEMMLGMVNDKQGNSVKLVAGIVLELGAGVEDRQQFRAGHKVFYPASAAVNIGNTTLMSMEAVFGSVDD